MKILVVDDSKFIRDMVKKMLTSNNFEVDTADNGAQALDKYVKFKPDLVMLDLSMPVMDGYETLKRILNLDANAKVVISTALEQTELLTRCLQKGAVGYVVKPFGMESLLMTIQNALTGRVNKNVNTLLTGLCSTFENVLKIMFDSNSSVVLEEVEVLHQERSLQTLSGTTISTIRAVPKVIQPLEIVQPARTTGYITEVGGQKRVNVITFIREDDISTLFNYAYKDADDVLEFVNILHSKIVSDLVNITHLILDTKPVRIYEHDKDKTIFSKELIKAKLKFVIRNNNIPIDIQLMLDATQIFGT